MKYTVFAGGEATEITKSKKQTAIDAATALRDENKVSVEVQTESGTVVFSQDAPKKINMSPQYSRTVVLDKLPEGVTVPEGKRVAYFRPRVGLAVLHDPTEGLEKAYSLLDTTKNKELSRRFVTTREAGAFMTERAEAKRLAKAEAEAKAAADKAAAESEEPANA